MARGLVAYWFRAQRLGYGVTAESREAARSLLAGFGYPRADEEIISIVDGVAFADLDARHVGPNAGPLVMRGVSFPRHNR